MKLRDKALEAVIAEVETAVRKDHERNYEKLHVRRDGTVTWFESINRSDNLIDSEADGFQPIESVITVGTGSVLCNCDYCNDVYNADEEREALADGREYDRDAKYDSRAEAIDDAVANSDLFETKDQMLERFDCIPAGYFHDEEEE